MSVLPKAGETNPDEGIGLTVGTAESPRTGFIENVSAGFQAAKVGPGSTRSRQNAVEAGLYDQVIKALSAEGELGEDQIAVRPGGWGYRGPKNIPVNQNGVGYVPKKRPFRNPYTDAPSLSQGDNPLARLYLSGDTREREAIWAAVQRVRQRKPDFLKDFGDEGALARRAQEERKQRLAKASDVTSRATTMGSIGAFTGAIGGSIAAGDPENFVGVGTGIAAGKTVARTVIKRAVTEGAINAAAGVIGLPGQALDAERLDDKMTPEDMARSIAEQGGVGFGLGLAIGVAPIAATKALSAGKKAAEATVDAAATIPAVRDFLAGASVRAGTVEDRSLLREYRRLHSPYDVADTSTATERAAVNVMERDVEVREQSPLSSREDGENEQRLDAVASALGVDLTPPAMPSTTPLQTPTVRDRSDGPAPRRAASYEEAVHRAEGTGKNPDSSATGHFQFIDSTWLEYAPKVTDTAGMSRQQILGLRGNRQIAERAERQFRADNARYLRERGVEDSPGNLSLAHFLGKRDAARVLRASPDTPIGQLVDAASIRANRNVFSKIGTAADMVQWGHGRIGVTVDAAPARADAIDEGGDLIDYMDLHPHEYATFAPDEVETDAGLFQYKSGGDDAGVTDKLAAVTAWNPTLSSEVMVWERADGRRFVVDGHQRTGLARRLFADDPSIRLRGIVFRESEGITPQQARTIGALRNIALGTGSLVDNARVLRDAPEGGQMIRGSEARREIEGLARLNYEAFGAAVNDVIDPRIAAQIGLHAGDKPDAHMPLVDLLLKERVSNPREASRVVRQAVADGFGTVEAEQMSLLGGAEPQQALYVPIARILDAAAKRLREEKRTFKVLAEKAGKIEAAGNVLDRTANQAKVIGNDEALAILEATAYRSGPVRDALIAAARAELSGSRRADAVNEFLGALGDIDLRAAARGVEPSGEDGAGVGGSRGADAASQPDADVPDRGEPSLYDQAVAARSEAERFSDPVGPAAVAQTAIIEHDLRMDPARSSNAYANPIADTPESIDAFWRWFGNSKVVDDTGRPLVVYHGGDDWTELPQNAATWFTDSEVVADGYADQGYGRPRISAVYLKLENPLDLRDPNVRPDIERGWNETLHGGRDIAPLIESLKEQGFDGVIHFDTNNRGSGKHTSYVAFGKGAQAKSAGFNADEGASIYSARDQMTEGNLGTFDPFNLSITDAETGTRIERPAVADRQRQETRLRAEAPLRPGNVDADGTMGLGLFDVADQPTFRLSDEGDARPLNDILQEAEADEAAAKAAAACLKPGAAE